MIFAKKIYRCVLSAGFAALNMAAVAAAQTDAAVAALISEAAAEHRLELHYDGDRFSGPAWRMLVAEGAAAQYFLLGEQHGIAENALLAAELFKALVPHGYRKAAIEISPPVARLIDRTLRDGGLDGLRALYAQPGGEPAFFGMQQEAQFIAAARAAVSDRNAVLWGLDYEVASDRPLVAYLQRQRKPPDARVALAELVAASQDCWNRYAETRSPQYIFSFCGDPELVRALRSVWPRRNAETTEILDTLEETLEINRLWGQGKGLQSNARRAALLRANFLHHWRAEKAAGRAPKVFAKFGASHLVRGLSTTEVFDLGTMLPELAAIDGGHAFSLLVLAGAGASTAQLDPAQWVYREAVPRDGYTSGLEPLIGSAFDDAFTLIDLRPLRPLLPASKRTATHPALMRIVHGYDAVLIMTGSTASTELVHPAADDLPAPHPGARRGAPGRPPPD